MSNLIHSQISFDIIPSRFTPKVTTATIALIITGSVNIILMKFQTRNLGLERSDVSIQSFIVMLGQFLNLIIFYLRICFSKRRKRTHFRKYKNKSLMSGKLYSFSSLRIGVASLLFCSSSLFQLYALAVISPTLYQMLLGCVIIFTPIISRIVLKKRMYKHTIVGMICTVVALSCICLSSYLLDEAKHDSKDAEGVELIMAIAMMICGLFLTSLQRVYEEWLLSKIEISAFRFVGLEGLYGILILTFVHGIYFAYGYAAKVQFFDAGAAIAQILGSWPLIITSLMLIVSVTFYDLNGVIITRKVSATYRVVNDVLRTILIWLAEILIYDLQSDITNKWVYLFANTWKLISYMLLLFGNILINELMDVGCCGLDKYFGKYNDTKLSDSIISQSDEYSIMKS